MTDHQRFALIWGLISLFFAILFVTKNSSEMVLMASTFAKFLAILAGLAAGLIGAAIGEALRRFALPDGFFTSGGMTSIVKTKLFWLFGPQLIGCIFGVLLGETLVLM